MTRFHFSSVAAAGPRRTPIRLIKSTAVGNAVVAYLSLTRSHRLWVP